MQTRLLSESEFKATFVPRMRDVTKIAMDVLDIWPYVDAVPQDELEGHLIFERFIEKVYRSGNDRFDHVQVMTKSPNVYLIVVVDLQFDCFYGHRLLDLNKEYGLD
jgi:hypothetical protein